MKTTTVRIKEDTKNLINSLKERLNELKVFRDIPTDDTIINITLKKELKRLTEDKN